MDEVNVVTLKDVKLKNPIMVEGLPGVGHVGKLVADHIVEELKAEKIIEVYSQHFPPQVLVMDDGTVRLVKNEIYAHKAMKGEKHDLLLLVGDYQSATSMGHYVLASTFLDIAEQYGVKRIYTLGGYGIGQLVEAPSVICAVNDIRMADEMRSYGAEFKENEPGGGIVGISGLLLGLAEVKGIEAACLMGVTSGYLVDPKSAQEVLKVLSDAIGIEVDMKPLEDRAIEMEKIMARLKEMEEAQTDVPGSFMGGDDDLRYIR